MFKASLFALFRFLSCTRNYMIPAAKTASNKQRYKLPGLLNSFSLAQRKTKFLDSDIAQHKTEGHVFFFQFH